MQHTFLCRFMPRRMQGNSSGSTAVAQHFMLFCYACVPRPVNPQTYIKQYCASTQLQVNRKLTCMRSYMLRTNVSCNIILDCSALPFLDSFNVSGQLISCEMLFRYAWQLHHQPDSLLRNTTCQMFLVCNFYDPGIFHTWEVSLDPTSKEMSYRT